MVSLFQRIASSETFQTFILWIILLTAFSMGLETVPSMWDNYGEWFDIFFYVTQVIFGAEILIRLLAYTPNYKKFFKEFWNTFDFVIVVASFLPGPGAFAPVARLLRIIRVLRVVSVSDRLRGFLDRMERTLDELACAALIVAILGYIFTIAGNYLFFEIDPEHWGGFGRSSLTVFYLLLLQDVPHYVGKVTSANAFNICYFIVFYLVIFSFFINVIGAISSEHHRDTTDKENND